MGEIHKVIDVAIYEGMDPISVWDYTLGELLKYINHKRKKELNEQKAQAIMIHKLAQLIIFSFNDPEKMPTPIEMFDWLFEDEKEELEKEESNQWMASKDKFLNFAYSHNVKQHTE